MKRDLDSEMKFLLLRKKRIGSVSQAIHKIRLTQKDCLLNMDQLKRMDKLNDMWISTVKKIIEVGFDLKYRNVELNG